MIIIKTELKSKLFIILIVVAVAMILGSIASVFIHFDFSGDNGNSYPDSNGYDNSGYSNGNSYDNSNYSSSNNHYNSSYNSSGYDNNEDENMTLEDHIKNTINDLL